MSIQPYGESPLQTKRFLERPWIKKTIVYLSEDDLRTIRIVKNPADCGLWTIRRLSSLQWGLIFRSNTMKVQILFYCYE